MDANDRRLLKQMVERDVARAIKILEYQVNTELQDQTGHKTPAQLPKPAARLLAEYNKHAAVLSALSAQLRAMGWDMPRDLAVRTYSGEASVPSLSTLARTAETKAVVQAELRKYYRPKRQLIEDAQSEALLNIIAGDLPGMRKELEKLNTVLSKIVGVKTLQFTPDE